MKPRSIAFANNSPVLHVSYPLHVHCGLCYKGQCVACYRICICVVFNSICFMLVHSSIMLGSAGCLLHRSGYFDPAEDGIRMAPEPEPWILISPGTAFVARRRNGSRMT